MEIAFHKYHGTGNDFVIIDNRENIFPKANIQLISRICHRHFGIGSDGLILIENHPTLDYHMTYFNSDGSQSLCGNGSRCGYAFARGLGIVNDKGTFETTDGIHKIMLIQDMVHLQLFDMKAPEKKGNDWFIDTGSPHYIIESESIEKIDIISQARKIRYDHAYSGQNGTNVNFVQFLPDNKVKMRTYERGVENETLSCGTGATAVALVGAVQGMQSPITLQTLGGHLQVSFEKKAERFSNIWLAGPAEKVFEGTISI